MDNKVYTDLQAVVRKWDVLLCGCNSSGF